VRPALSSFGAKPSLGSVTLLRFKFKKANLPGRGLIAYPNYKAPDGGWLLAFQFGNLGGAELEEQPIVIMCLKS
jgi:hypothetical protein